VTSSPEDWKTFGNATRFISNADMPGSRAVPSTSVTFLENNEYARSAIMYFALQHAAKRMCLHCVSPTWRLNSSERVSVPSLCMKACATLTGYLSLHDFLVTHIDEVKRRLFSREAGSEGCQCTRPYIFILETICRQTFQVRVDAHVDMVFLVISTSCPRYRVMASFSSLAAWEPPIVLLVASSYRNCTFSLALKLHVYAGDIPCGCVHQ
jgi:hypothetical protein